MPARFFKVTQNSGGEVTLKMGYFKWPRKTMLKKLEEQVHDAGVTDYVGKTRRHFYQLWLGMVSLYHQPKNADDWGMVRACKWHCFTNMKSKQCHRRFLLAHLAKHAIREKKKDHGG